VVACPGGQCDGTTLFAFLAEASDYNAQISYGEDVITALSTPDTRGLKKLQDVVVSTINKDRSGTARYEQDRPDP